MNYISDVKRAILGRQNGQLIIVKKGERKRDRFPCTDGQVQTNIAETLDLEENWLEENLSIKVISLLQEVYLGESIIVEL